MTEWTSIGKPNSTWNGAAPPFVSTADSILSAADYGTMADILTAVGSDNRTVYINKDITISSTTTLSTNVSIIVTQGGKFHKVGTGALVANGPFSAGLYQVFSGFSAGDVTGLKDVRPEWFGSVPGTTAYLSSEFVVAYASTTNKNTIITDAPYVVDSSVSSLGINASMAVYDGFLYVCEYANSSIAVYSLRNPAIPVLISRLALAGGANPRGIFVRDDVAYIVNHGTHTIQLIDVSNKNSLTSIATFAAGRNNPKDLTANGNDLYVCFNSGYVQKWTIDGRDLITKRYENTTSSQPLTVAVANDGLYVGGQSGKIDFFTLSTLASATSTTIDTWISFLESRGDVLYAVDYSTSKLYVLDIKSATTPTVITSLNTSTNPSTIRIVGNKLYVPCLSSPGYLDVFDISNPSAPVKLYKLTTNTGQAGFMAFYHKYAYVSGHVSPLTLDAVFTGQEYVESDYVTDQKNRAISNYLRDHQPYSYIVTKISDYTVTIQDQIVRVGIGAPITLPIPSIEWTGKIVTIANVHVTSNSNVTDGTNTWVVGARQSRTFICDGAQWDTLSSHRAFGYLDKSVAGVASATLTAIEADNDILAITGVASGAVTITVPLIYKQWTVYNNTGQTCTFIGSTGTGVTVANGKRAIIYSDTINVVRVTPDT